MAYPKYGILYNSLKEHDRFIGAEKPSRWFLSGKKKVRWREKSNRLSMGT